MRNSPWARSASGGARWLNENVLAQLDDAAEALAEVTEAEMRELEKARSRVSGATARP